MEAWRLNRTGSSGQNNWTFFSVNARYLWTRGICRSWLLLFDKLVRNNNRREAASAEARDLAPVAYALVWPERRAGWVTKQRQRLSWMASQEVLSHRFTAREKELP